MDSIHGEMEGPLKDNTQMIRNMGMVSMNGQMVENTWVTGSMESNMDWGSMKFLRKDSSSLVFGKKENEFNGLTNSKLHKSHKED